MEGAGPSDGRASARSPFVVENPNLGSDNGVLTSPTLLSHLVDPERREEAWRVFLERYRPLIRGWCRRWGLKDGGADDVTAAVLAKLVRIMEKFVYDPTQSFRAWLRVVVDHEACDLWRQRRRHAGERSTGDKRVQERLEEVPTSGAIDELVGELNESLERAPPERAGGDGPGA